MVNREDFTRTMRDSAGNVVEEWSVDDFGHMRRIYMIPPKQDRTETEDNQSGADKTIPQVINTGSEYDSSEFASRVATKFGEYVKDDSARLIGGQWFSGKSKVALRPVPKNVNLSLRKWNGLPARISEIIAVMVQDIDEEMKSEIADRSSSEWDEIVSGLVTPQRKFADQLAKSRARAEFDASDMMSYMAELDNLGLADLADTDAPYESGSYTASQRMSQLMATKLAAWEYSKKKQTENPSFSLSSAPRLEIEEVQTWADAASLGVAVAIRQSSETLELALGDKLPETLFDRLVRRHLTEQEPGASTFDDFELAADLVKTRFGYLTSLDVAVEDGTIGPKDLDDIVSGKVIEQLKSGEQFTFNPKTKASNFKLAAQLNIRHDVPDDVPNDKQSPNFRPYFAPQSK